MIRGSYYNQMIKNIANMRGSEEIYRYVKKYGLEGRLEFSRIDAWDMRDLEDMIGNRPSGLVADEDDDA